MTAPNSIRTGSVQVKFLDGTERTLPIHGITQMQVVRVLDELGVKSFEELKGPEPTFAAVRFVTKVAAEALSFPKIQDVWTIERLEESFRDMTEVVKVFTACIALSELPQAPSTSADKPHKTTPYH